MSDGAFEAPVDELQKIRPFRLITPVALAHAGWHATPNRDLGERTR